MKNLKRKTISCMLMVIVMLFAMPVASALAADNNYIEILKQPPNDPDIVRIEGAQVEQTMYLDLWHYSGGYWQVGNKGSEKIQLTDDDMKFAFDKSQIISAEKAEFTVPLPADVISRMQAGKKITVEIRPGNEIELKELFVTEGMQYKIVGTNLLLSAKPKFNVVKLPNLAFKDYGLNIKNVVPFIAPKYGYNMYSIFGNGFSQVQVNGWVNPGDPGSLAGMPTGRIHPTMIADVSGKLKPGSQIYINSVLKDSDGYQIGQGTFTNAGACGLHFDYPVQFVFYESDPPPICSACGKCELHKPGVCTMESCDNYGSFACGCYKPEQVVAPPDTKGNCAKEITWSEIQYHEWYCNGSCNPDGPCKGHDCWHVYTYKTILSSAATITPNTLKSGYGFGVTLKNKITTSQISNMGACGGSYTKKNSLIPTPPTAAEVKTTWTVINKEKKKTQQTVIPLERTSKTATTSNFGCAPNQVSHEKNKLIYTDVALKGTAKKPVKHNFTISTKGGGVNGVEFCGTLTESITINGNMYEDDWTVDGN